ncbi:reverse transcriptase domain-containing protein [Tanacetum coccineum]
MATLTDAVNAMLRHVKTSSPETVKAIYESCVTCGGPHPYYECLAVDGNTFNASTAIATYNQNKGYHPHGDPNYHANNQMGPPGFPPVQNNQNCFNQNHGYNQNQGNNFNQGNQNYQALPQVAPSNELSNYKKINDANMKAMQNKINNVTNELRNEMQASIQTSMLNQTNELKNTMAIPIDELVVSPKPIPFIPYPSRANKQKLHEKDDNLALKFVEILFRPWAILVQASNLMPLSIWKKLSLHELTPTRMILDLADRSTTSPSGIAEDFFVKVGKLHFPADFIVVDYVVDPRNSSTSGNFTPSLDPILSTSFPSLTPFEGGDFILEEIEACLINDSIPPGIDDADFDPEGDLLLLEKLLNDDPSSPLPSKELHFKEIKTIKSSIDDPSELELKDLPSHLEYAFLEGTNKLPIIISKDLKDEEKTALLKVLKSHKQAIAWKISDI